MSSSSSVVPPLPELPDITDRAMLATVLEEVSEWLFREGGRAISGAAMAMGGSMFIASKSLRLVVTALKTDGAPIRDIAEFGATAIENIASRLTWHSAKFERYTSALRRIGSAAEW
ncbi:MAG: hypothetical protein ABI142_03695 [Bryocella sp.]